MQGRVVTSNGLAASGAHVVANSICASTYSLVEETITNPDGYFSIKSYDPDCNKYQFSASHREALWLPTGDNGFSMTPNGTNPVIELKPGQIPAPILLRLEQQGGEVELIALDEATRSYIYAGLSIRREPVGKKTFSSRLSIATGEDGSSHTLFLPPGEYALEIDRYMCHDKIYWSAKPPTFRFTIEVGMRQTLTLRLNIVELEAKTSYANPEGKRCSP
jgi:hypothetical protein